VFSINDLATIWFPCVIFVAGNLLFGNRIGIHQRLHRLGVVRPGVRTWVEQQSAISENLLYFSVLDFYFDGIHYRFDDHRVDDSADTVSYVPSDAKHLMTRVWVDPRDPRVAVSSEGPPHGQTLKLIVGLCIGFNVIVIGLATGLGQRFGGTYAMILLAIVLVVLGICSTISKRGTYLWRRARPVVTSSPWRYVREFDESLLRDGQPSEIRKAIE